jgi:hypothetical protein
MPRQTLCQSPRGNIMRDLPNRKSVITDNGSINQPGIRLGRGGLLIGPRISQQMAVEFLEAAVKAVE